MWYLLHHVRTGLNFESTGSTYEAVSVENVGNLFFLVPSFIEQTAIATFLDRETSQIDALIEKKKRQIELLKEKRSALISHAVTKGLDPKAKMKDSGIEWLGEIPEHWGVWMLKHLCTQAALYGANIAATYYTETGIRFIRTTDLTDNGLLKKGGVSVPKEVVGDYLLNDGDILISRSGTIGRSFLYESKLHGPCAYAGYLVRFILSSCVLPRYVFFFTKTQAFSGFLRVMAISSTIENVNGEKYANAAVPLPPLPEQTAIANHLDRETEKTDALIDKVQKSIELLREKRSALITATVTGKIDVREKAA